MLPVLVLALYWFARRTKPEWSPWILRGVVILCLVVPTWDIPAAYLPTIIVAILLGALLGHRYRDAKSV